MHWYGLWATVTHNYTYRKKQDWESAAMLAALWHCNVQWAGETNDIVNFKVSSHKPE